MSVNKEDILANFQSIADCDDVALAFTCLENSNWDLVNALRSYMPQYDMPQYTGVDSQESDKNMTNESVAPQSQAQSQSESQSQNDLNDLNDLSGPSTSKAAAAAPSRSSRFRSDYSKNNENIVLFHIHFKLQTYKIKMSTSDSIGNLKERIYQETKVPLCRQALKGWPANRNQDAHNPTTVIKKLNLGRLTHLHLQDLTEEGYYEKAKPEKEESKEDILKKRAETRFKLHIHRQPEDTTISLEYSGTQTILGVKSDVYNITDIAVRHQVWSGWPEGVTNSTTLAESNIEYSHNLTLRSNANTENASKPSQNTNNVINLDTDSSDGEFEDASDFNTDDDFFSDMPTRPRNRFLISDGTDDEIVGSIQFVQNYVQRYGEPHPVFFQGSLNDALKEACHKPLNKRKLLAIYLHHDHSVLTNVFCDQLLRCESVMQTLAHNFVLYGWDLTFESNKNLFLSSISACVGVAASIEVRNTPVDSLPAILIVAKNRSVCDVMTVIHGNLGVDDFLSRIMETVELYSQNIRVEKREEEKRAARAQVKFEQDMAYQQTLEADRAKEALRKQKEMEEAAEKQRIESERAAQNAIKEANRQEAERSLPDEPPKSVTNNVTLIKIREPSGSIIERRFYYHDKLRDLINYLVSKGFLIDKYKLISNWPRRDLALENKNATLEELHLCPQECVFLEER